MIGDRLFGVGSWFGSKDSKKSEKPAPAVQFEEWAQPLADRGVIDKSHLYLISEIKKQNLQHPEAVLEVAAGIPGRESTKMGWDIYRLANQTKDGPTVALAVKAYQTVLQGSDDLTPTRRETLFLNMFKLHQNADQALSSYQGYLKGEGSPDEKLLGDLCTFNPGYGQFQSAETIFETFQFARALSPEDRQLFLSLHEAHGFIANPEDQHLFRDVWSTACAQPDKAQAIANFHELRQHFAEMHPRQPHHQAREIERCWSGFARRVFSEEKEALPVYLRLWKEVDSDPTACSHTMEVLRQRVANGQASLTLDDAIAVRRGLVASETLSKMLHQDDLRWLSGEFSAQEFGHVASAMASVGSRSQPALERLVTQLKQISQGATPEQKKHLHARLHEICAHALLFNGDADLALDEVAADRRGITVTDNRVQVGSVSVKRRGV